MEYEILYYYDFWNDREEKELYNQTFCTEWDWKGLLVGTRLYMFNDIIARATANITEIKEATENIKIVITARNVTVVKILKYL